MKSKLIKIAIWSTVVILLLSLLWLPTLWLFVILIPIVALGYYDYHQTRHSILRNFPVIGHGRWIMERIRPFVRQYFFESETDGTSHSTHVPLTDISACQSRFRLKPLWYEIRYPKSRL
ncbi:hypothetical protein P4S73_28650 [Paraglaciecola sp. Hal342]